MRRARRPPSPSGHGMVSVTSFASRSYLSSTGSSISQRSMRFVYRMVLRMMNFSAGSTSSPQILTFELPRLRVKLSMDLRLATSMISTSSNSASRT